MQFDTRYHDGELAVQRRAGESDTARRNGALIANTISKGARSFLAQQRLAVLASQDREGRIWASTLCGFQPFMSTPDGKRVAFHLTSTVRNIHDPFWNNIQINPQVGMLAIDLETRGRLRVNGIVDCATSAQMNVNVAAAYPNCPQYIQRRRAKPQSTETSPRLVDRGTRLDRQTREIISRSDTLFVASGHVSGLDASHRGGPRGFVEIVDDVRLRIPDYAGNGMFNTLGNFCLNPAAGLVFPDFERGRTLQMTGVARILWDQQDEVGETGGTHRYWDFKIDRWIVTEFAMPQE